MRFEEVKRADEEQVQTLSALATSIVREHFDPIIGKAQNDYMLEKFQSVPALRSPGFLRESLRNAARGCGALTGCVD